MQTTDKKFNRVWAEFTDMLVGVVFPFIVLVIFSATIILLASSEEADLPLQIVITSIGEVMSIAALVVFGRQNGMAAYKKTTLNNARRMKGVDEPSVTYRIGEYAVWKGFVIGAMTASFFFVLQIVECIVHTPFIYFLLQYACSWAVGPLTVAGVASTSPLNLLMAVLPVLFLGVSYIWGGKVERDRTMNYHAAEDKARGKR